MNQIDLTALESLQANWHYPAPIRFGVGRINELQSICNELNISRPLLVTDEGLKSMAFVQAMIDANNQAGIATDVFSDIKPNPTGTNVEAGVRAYKAGAHDGVIAVGGGSALDAAKAIALMVDQAYPLWDFEDVGDNWTKVNTAGMAPLIAIPTTAGTGSEVGRASVIVDEQDKAKKIIFHPNMMPNIILEDPALTQGLPAGITAATGVDAFVHSLEAFCAPFYHPMADGIALEGMRLIKTWLPEAYSNGDNLVARSHLLIASSMGATAFQKGLGGIHALAHPLGAIYDKHHGLLNAILMPYVLTENKQEIEGKIQHIARYLELADDSFNGFMDWLLEFRRQLNIQHSLSEIGIEADDASTIGKLATQDPSAGGNPIQLQPAQYSDILVRAVKGNL